MNQVRDQLFPRTGFPLDEDGKIGERGGADRIDEPLVGGQEHPPREQTESTSVTAREVMKVRAVEGPGSAEEGAANRTFHAQPLGLELSAIMRTHRLTKGPSRLFGGAHGAEALRFEAKGDNPLHPVVRAPRADSQARCIQSILILSLSQERLREMARGRGDRVAVATPRNRAVENAAKQLLGRRIVTTGIQGRGAQLRQMKPDPFPGLVEELFHSIARDSIRSGEVPPGDRERTFRARETPALLLASARSASTLLNGGFGLRKLSPIDVCVSDGGHDRDSMRTALIHQRERSAERIQGMREMPGQCLNTSQREQVTCLQEMVAVMRAALGEGAPGTLLRSIELPHAKVTFRDQPVDERAVVGPAFGQAQGPQQTGARLAVLAGIVERPASKLVERYGLWIGAGVIRRELVEEFFGGARSKTGSGTGLGVPIKGFHLGRCHGVPRERFSGGLIHPGHNSDLPQRWPQGQSSGHLDLFHCAKSM